MDMSSWGAGAAAAASSVAVLAMDEQLFDGDVVGFGFHHAGSSSSGLPWCDFARPRPPAAAAADPSYFGIHEQYLQEEDEEDEEHEDNSDDIAPGNLMMNPFTWLQQQQPCNSSSTLPVLSEVEIERSISNLLEELPDIIYCKPDPTSSLLQFPQSTSTNSHHNSYSQTPPNFPATSSFGKSGTLMHGQQQQLPYHEPFVDVVTEDVITTGCDPPPNSHPPAPRHPHHHPHPVPDSSITRAHKRSKIMMTAAADHQHHHHDHHLQLRPGKKHMQVPVQEPKLENDCSPGAVQQQQINRRTASRWSRPSDQAEHILRERHRRDDMTVKYSILESLLPPGSKRDRATIVEDAIKFVKDLQHRRDKLLKRCSRTKPAVPPDLPAAASRDAVRMQTVMLQFTMPAAAIKMRNSGTVGADSSSPPLALSIQESMPGSESMVTRPDCYVHSDLLNEIMIEMMCKPRPNFQSILLQAIESQNLELVRCTITKTPIGMICIIVAKQQNYQGSPHSHASIVQALKAAVQVA